MVIDACDRFAERTAAWIMKAKMSKTDVAVRLKLFDEEHVVRIGEAAKKLRHS